MASYRSWRRLCIIIWFIYTQSLVSGLQTTPLSPPSSKPHNANQLTPRATSRADASCPVKGYTACGNGLADYFCCSSETTCMVLAEKTTALCCPKGSSCDTISPITCDVTLQDVIENPTSPIHTTRLKESLPLCGFKCCPFGYTCRDGSACVLDDGQEQEGSRTSSTSVSSTKTRTRTATSTIPTTATQAATSTTTVETVPAASPTPSANPGDNPPTPSAVPPTSETETPAAAAASPRTSTSGVIIAGTTVAAIASVAGLTCLLWFKRRSISETVGSAKFPRPWQQLREHGSDQDVSLPRYNSPPPAYAVEMKPPLAKPYTWKHYSPDSFGRDRYDVDDGSVPVPVSVGLALAVELPATPVSFSQWRVREEGEATRPRSHYEPYRRPS